MGRYVKVSSPDENAEPLMGGNGQPEVYNVFSSGPDGTHPLSKYAAALIVMQPGVVSAVHMHPEEEVLLTCVDAAPWGALTLSGDNLDDADWIRPGEVKTIPPLIPHIAVYPSSMPGHQRPDGALPPACRVYEFKARSAWREDTFRRPELNRRAVERIAELGLLGVVDLPDSLRFWVPGMRAGIAADLNARCGG